MPLAFVRDGDGFQLVALLSWEAGKNLFVGRNGQWRPGTYVPVIVRTYPFQYLRHDPDGQMALGFDEESGLVVAAGGEVPLFEGDGQLSGALTEIVGILDAQEKSRRATAAAIAALSATGVIVPWDLKIPVGGTTKAVSGLFNIDESGLQRLDDGAFRQLRNAGSLGIAYAQLISMVCIDALVRLARQQAVEQKAVESPASRGFALSDILTRDDILRFD